MHCFLLLSVVKGKSKSEPNQTRDVAPAGPVRLVAQIHDELLFEVDASRVNVASAAADVRQIMEGEVWLTVLAAERVPRLGIPVV